MHDLGRRSRSLRIGVALAVLGLVVAWLGHRAQVRSYESALLRTWPSDLQRDPQLLRTAAKAATALYVGQCASCHGADLTGDRARGVPSLIAPEKIYGDGGIGDLENTILYGVRSGHPKAHNVTDMPAEGRTHQLTAEQIADVVEYLLSLNRKPHDAAAAQRGQAVFYDAGNCFDCHGGDAQGNADYGAPSLVGSNWIYGDDRRSLYQSVYDGRHGLCPAWSRTLSAAQVRALAALLYVESHQHGG
jgi:cytochrome c oxidase cbb3-type subunit 3